MTKRQGIFLDAATMACDLVQPASLQQLDSHRQTTPEQTAERIAGYEVAITNKVAIGRQELDAAPDLQLIVVAATGYDIIDLQACRDSGVAVANSPGYSVSSVPEHALGLMFAVARSIVPLSGQAVDGTWSDAGIFCLHTQPVIELGGRRVGIIGSGSLGRATGKLCASLGMEVVYSKSARGAKDDLDRLELDELLATSDIVSLHCPLDDSNRQMFNADAFAKMKPGAILINTARGGLIDDAALVAALEAGSLGGAGIDVLVPEPPPTSHPLLNCRHPGLVVTPHVAWASMESQQRLAAMLAETVDAFFAGRPQHIVS